MSEFQISENGCWGIPAKHNRSLDLDLWKNVKLWVIVVTPGINYFGKREPTPCVDHPHVLLYQLAMLDSGTKAFRTILNSVTTVTAENYSHLCFSDEETQADDYMSWVRSVRSVKKSAAGWKQTPDFQKSNLAFQKTSAYQKHAEI